MNVRPRAWISSLVLATALGVASPAAARDDASPYETAKTAWETGDLDGATPLYEQAVTEGGLNAAQVVEASARVGTYMAASGKPEKALSSFRLCAAIDPGFQLPPESGPKAAALYARARKEAAQMGGKLELTAEVPTHAEPGRKVSVVAHIPEGFAPLADKITIEVKDPAGGKPWRSSAPADATVTFDVPGSAITSGANLFVRFAAVDAHGNRYAEAEARLKVKGRAPVVEAVPEPTPDDEDEEAKPPPPASAGFWSWSSPWPYAIGGAILAGSIGIYAATRPSDSVTVNAPAWR